MHCSSYSHYSHAAIWKSNVRHCFTTFPKPLTYTTGYVFPCTRLVYPRDKGIQPLVRTLCSVSFALNSAKRNCASGSSRHACAPEPAAMVSWVCPECKKRFLSAGTLERHRRTRHAVQHAEEEEELHNALRASNAELEKYATSLNELLQELRQRTIRIETRESVTRTENGGRRGSFSLTSNAGEGCYSAVHQASPQTVPVNVVRQRWTRSARLSNFSRNTVSESSSHDDDPHVRERGEESENEHCTALGTGLSHWMAIGEIYGKVRWGYLSGHLRQEKDDTEKKLGKLESTDLPSNRENVYVPIAEREAPLVAEFTLETHGYLERTPGQMMLHRNRVPVRIFGMQSSEEAVKGHSTCENILNTYSLSSVVVDLQPGDTVRVRGQYGLHASFDVVSKRLIENVVVEADSVEVLQKASRADDVSVAAKGSMDTTEDETMLKNLDITSKTACIEMKRHLDTEATFSQEQQRDASNAESLKKKIQSRLAFTSAKNSQKLRKRRGK